ncbi:hypothetical protein DENIS_1892 [Desulfonema ishimotonii]|uniref:Flippase-like domain-containing protein n=2 Tax=Desulfonema ishimotonii TaxID=45657 RepID=A0A401FVD4_9BACT|nr:hypothetical protein DENIS_1892 [Desulfonema ishimotonii]
MVGIGLAGSLVHTTLMWTGGDLGRALAQPGSPLLLFCLFFHGLVVCMTSSRWRLLLNVQGVHISLAEAMRLTLMGFFFSLALPGTVSGDVMKMAFVTRRTETRKAEAAMTVMLDRIFGVFGLFTVSAVVVMLSLPFLLSLGQEYRLVRISAFLAGSGSLGVIIAFLLLWFHESLLRISYARRLIGFLARRLPEPVVEKFSRLACAIVLYAGKPGIVLSALGLSVLVHSCLALNLFCIGRVIGENILGVRDYFLATQVANAVAAIPLTPGGIGTRDATIALFFNAMNASSDQIGVIPVVMTVILVCWGGIGGIIFTLAGQNTEIPVHKTSDAYGVKPH